MAKKIVLILLPLLIFIFFTAVLFRPYIFGGKVPIPGDILIGHYHPWKDVIWEGRTAGYPIKNFILFDGIRQTLPWRLLAIEQLKSGKWSLWNPYIFSGTPLLGNLQVAVLYPFNILFFILPKFDAWSIYILLQPILAGLFTYFFLRTIYCSRKASLLAGICFGFSLIMMNHLEFGINGHTALWLPLGLGAINKIQQSGRWRWGLILMIAMAMSLLGGYPPLVIYNFIILVFYALFKIRPLVSFKFLLAIGSLGFAFLLTAIQILPAFELASKVIREETQFGVLSGETYFFPWENLIMVVAPDFFGHPSTGNFFSKVFYPDNPSVGIIGLLLVVYSFLWALRKKETLFWIFFAVFPIFLMLETPLGQVIRFLPISIFSLITPMKMIWIVAFSLSVLAGIGMDVIPSLVKEKKFWKFVFPLVLVWEIIFFLWIVSFLIPHGEYILVAQRNLILPTLFLGVGSVVLIFLLFFPKLWPILAGFVILLSGTELVHQGIKYNPFILRNLIFPQTQILSMIQKDGKAWRTMVTHPELLPVNSNIPYHIPMIDGYASIYDGRSGQMIHLANSRYPLTKLEAYPRTVFQTEYNSSIINLLNVKYVLALKELKKDDSSGMEKLKPIMREGKTILYENKNVLPKVFFVESYEIGIDDLDVVNKMLTNDLGQKVILEKEPGVNLDQLKIGQVEISNYRENEILLKSKNDGLGLLVVTDSFDKGWQATIDGQKQEILRADFNLRALLIPEGEHQIKFLYQPQSFKIGLYLSLGGLSLLLVGGIMIFIFRKESW